MNFKLYCSECGEQLEIEDVDEMYNEMWIRPCENCLEILLDKIAREGE